MNCLSLWVSRFSVSPHSNESVWGRFEQPFQQRTLGGGSGLWVKCCSSAALPNARQHRLQTQTEQTDKDCPLHCCTGRKNTAKREHPFLLPPPNQLSSRYLDPISKRKNALRRHFDLGTFIQRSSRRISGNSTKMNFSRYFTFDAPSIFEEKIALIVKRMKTSLNKEVEEK